MQIETKGGVSRRILVVDDNRDNAEMLQLLLEGDGFTVAVAHEGGAAIIVAQDWHPDTIIMDIGLPDLDGYEVARRIRALPGGDAIMLIAVTGWGDDESRRCAAAAGINHHLVKPINPGTLQQYLRSKEGQ